MNPELAVSDQQQFLAVKVRGRLEPDSIFGEDNLFAPIATACREHRQNKVLIDVSELSGDWGLAAFYKSGKDLAVCRLPPPVSAFVVPPELVDERCFFETVARNRGAVTKVFTDSESARSWLNEAP